MVMLPRTPGGKRCTGVQKDVHVQNWFGTKANIQFPPSRFIPCALIGWG